MAQKTFLPNLLVLLSLLMLGACSSVNKPGVTPHSPSENPGMVHIRYLYGESDLQPLPTGFDVYRCDVPTGPFARINPTPIQPKRSPKVGELQLLMTDKGVTLGESYYYYIEKVYADGRRQKATSVAEAKVTLPQMGGKQPSSPKKAPK